MKRSEINKALKELEAVCQKYHCYLPPFCHFTPEEWETKGHEYDEVRDCCLGWDITDYGMGDFEKMGFSLITIRNGHQKMQDKYPKVYAEKLLYLKEGQYAPNHFHWYKTEDIINRGGGNILIRVYNSHPDESIDYESDVTVHTDGRTYTVPAGTQIRLTPGESIFIQQYLYHDFEVEPGTGNVLLGEVSQCNDDANDNRFNPVLEGRFPAIEEDEAPYRLLCTEYPKAKRGNGMIEVVALGELLIDFASKGADSKGYPLMQALPGGAPANFLAALTKYGKSTAFLGKVGDDTFGHLLLGTVKDAGIETKGIVVDPSVFTTLAFVTFDETGDRSFSFARKPGADTQLSWEEVDKSLIDEAKVFHFGTLSLTDEPARTATQKAVAYAKEQGKLITCDPNLRKPLWPSEEEAKEQILWSLNQADVVKISDEEVEFLWNSTPEEGADKLLSEFGVSLAMVTLGPKGCLLKTKNAVCQVASPKVNPIDTTGAGDIFGGSAVCRLLELNKPIEDLTAEDLHYIGAFASTAASLSTEAAGGIPSIPEKDAVLKAM